MRHARYMITAIHQTFLKIKDLGPWDEHPTVTNDAEWVVDNLNWLLRGRRLLYIDSEGNEAEIVVENGKFAGFQQLLRFP